MGLAIGPVSRLMTRSMYMFLNFRRSWGSVLRVSKEALQELQFWRDFLADHCCQPIWHFPFAVRVVYSDASETGYGGYVVEHGACVS